MHPRNRYKDRPPDFGALAEKHPRFRQYCSLSPAGKVKLDFQDPAAVRTLTECLLDSDFGLKVTIPPDCLVPRIPQRLNYLLWIQDLLSAQPTSSLEDLPADTVVGIDIGTGASCVYALLGARELGWSFVATEKDPSAAAVAARNVTANGLDHMISVVKVQGDTALGEAVLAELKKRDELRRTVQPAHSAPESTFSDSCCSQLKIPSSVDPNQAGRPAKDSPTSNLSSGNQSSHDVVLSKSGGAERVLAAFCMCNPPFYDTETTGGAMSDIITVAKLTGNLEPVNDSSASSSNQPEEEEDLDESGAPGGLKTSEAAVFNSSDARLTSNDSGVNLGVKGQRRDHSRPRPPPSSATVARGNEVGVEGGEVAFVSGIVRDSARIQTGIGIYTSMVGKKSSLAPLKRAIRAAGALSQTETAFVQGKTQRWALAWTFRPDVKRSCTAAPARCGPYRVTEGSPHASMRHRAPSAISD